MSDKLNFEVTGARRIAAKPDGTPRRNSLEFNIMVDGTPHIIRVRRETGVLKTPTLADHPHLAEIKKRILEYIQARTREAYQRHLAQRSL